MVEYSMVEYGMVEYSMVGYSMALAEGSYILVLRPSRKGHSRHHGL